RQAAGPAQGRRNKPSLASEVPSESRPESVAISSGGSALVRDGSARRAWALAGTGLLLPSKSVACSGTICRSCPSGPEPGGTSRTGHLGPTQRRWGDCRWMKEATEKRARGLRPAPVRPKGCLVSLVVQRAHEVVVQFGVFLGALVGIPGEVRVILGAEAGPLIGAGDELVALGLERERVVVPLVRRADRVRVDVEAGHPQAELALISAVPQRLEAHLVLVTRIAPDLRAGVQIEEYRCLVLVDVLAEDVPNQERPHVLQIITRIAVVPLTVERRAIGVVRFTEETLDVPD